MIPTPITQANYVLPLNETARQPCQNAAQYLAELGKVLIVLIVIIGHVFRSFRYPKGNRKEFRSVQKAFASYANASC